MEQVNINWADIDKLQKIIHIGPIRADIIVWETSIDKFKDIYELSKILGLGQKRMDDIIKQGIATV